jgi:hypothetical protein
VVAEALEYRVAAPPSAVLESISAASTRGSMLGFAIGDNARAQLIGGIRKNHEGFDLRLARGLGTPPRVVVLRGRVSADGAGTMISARYTLHPLARFARTVFVLLFLAFALIALPGAGRDPQLLWIPVVMGFIVLLMLVPFEWLAHFDRRNLRSALEEILGRAGPITRLQGRSS